MLSRQTVLDIACKLRCTDKLLLNAYYTPSGVGYGADFVTGSLNADSEIGIRLSHDGNITEDSIYLQFVVLYTDFYGQRKLRVINFELVTTTSDSNYSHQRTLLI